MPYNATIFYKWYDYTSKKQGGYKPPYILLINDLVAVKCK